MVRAAAVRRGLYVLASICALGGVTLACGSAALAARAHVPGGTFGQPCTTEPCGNGQLKEPEDVAVNEATGNVYVADKGDNRVEYFSAGGTYLGQFNGSGLLPGEGTGAPSGQISGPTTVAVDNACQLHQPVLTEATTPTCHEFDPSDGDVYVLDEGHYLIDKFTATGEYLNQIVAHHSSPGFTAILGMSVDRNGLLWTWEYGELFNHEELDKYSDGEVNELLSTWYATYITLYERAPNFVVEPTGSSYYFYVGEFAFPAKRFKLVHETITNANSDAEDIGSASALGLAAEPKNHDIYVDAGSQVTRYNSALAPVEQLGSGTLLGGSGMGVNNTTEELYVADSSADDVEIFVPRPPGAPTVSSSASSVTGDSAIVDATINPEGSSTSYRVEYGPTTAYGQSAPSPEGEVGSGYEASEVAIPVQGLLSHTVYHYRVVVKNSLGTKYGEAATFTTQATGVVLTLADERSWEMVSPPNKNGALFFEARFPVEAAANGDAFIGLASQPIEDSAEGSSAYVNVLMTRGPESWNSQTISPAHAQGTGQTAGSEYRAFSEDLSRALLQPYGSFTGLSPEASETTPYLRTNYLSGNVNDHCTSGCFQPLATASNTIPGAEFGETKTCVGVFCGPVFLTATPDLSNVLISSKIQLTPEPAPNGGTYEWANGALHLVSSEVPAAGGARNETERERAEQRFGTQAISTNGQRIVLAGGGSEAIYLHEMPTGANIRLDEPEGGPGPSVAPQFAGASSDASRIFFIDSGRLTATSSSSGADLYEYDMERPAGERLTDLSVDTNAGEAAGVGTVLGESRDGSYVYFAATGVLAPGASACSGGCNIYVRHDGVTSFVTGEWEGGGGLEQQVRVSPNGEWLAFMSNKDLTGYDTRDAITGTPDEEVYLYGALAKHLICGSCDPTGARPVAPPHASGEPAAAAANVPAWDTYFEYVLPHQPRYLTDEGRLFFNSYGALVPQDTDGTEDVYEFEPAGSGRCTTSVSTYVEAMNGCLGLISSGTSPEESTFMDASELAGDVFFRTAARLAPQDFDNAMDIYDAHECTAAVPCVPAALASSPPCATEAACKPAPTPQPDLFSPAPSATFSGPGNVSAATPAPSVKPAPLTRAQKLSRALKVCRAKRSRQRRRSCEAEARKRYGRKAGKANSKKKGGR